MFFKGAIVGCLAVTCVWLNVSPANADHCDDMYSRLQDLDRRHVQEDARTLSEDLSAENGGCLIITRIVRHVEERIPIPRQVEMACGSRFHPNCDTSCQERFLAENRSKARETCTPKRQQAANPPAQPPASELQQQQPPLSPIPAAVFRPQNAVSCGSDVTGVGGPPANTQTCLNNAKWSGQQPYNHSVKPIQFHQFDGPDVVAKLGDSIWSIPDQASPTGRRLEARPYDNETTTGNGACAQEGTSATVQPFIVNIQCEIERQAKLEKELEHREDVCVSQSKCRGPIQFSPNWRQYPLSYWKANPQQVIGGCAISDDPRDAGRARQQHCVRDQNWHTASECSDYGKGSSINGRGLLGCVYNEGVTTGPVQQQASTPPDQDSASNWLIIAGSWPVAEEDTNAKARARQSFLSAHGMNSRIAKTNDYPGLTPNLLAVVLGPFNREQAEVQLLVVQANVTDAYIKKAF